MKLINVIQHPDYALIYHKPDNCLVRNNEAFYLPDFATIFIARIAYVIKIKKIGKQIKTHFAHRYYDEVSVGLNIEAKDKLAQLRSQGLPWDQAVCFDYSAPLGTFTNKQTKKHIQLFINNNEQVILDLNQLHIDKIIADISHQFTLKIGDLIYISLPREDSILSIGQEFSVCLNNEELLTCAIK